MNEKKYKQLRAGLLIATIIVWCIFGYLYLEGTWKEELEEQRNMTQLRYGEIDWDTTTFPYHFYYTTNITEGLNNQSDV